jgi:hypothetical protein
MRQEFTTSASSEGEACAHEASESGLDDPASAEESEDAVISGESNEGAPRANKAASAENASSGHNDGVSALTSSCLDGVSALTDGPSQLTSGSKKGGDDNGAIKEKAGDAARAKAVVLDEPKDCFPDAFAESKGARPNSRLFDADPFGDADDEDWPTDNFSRPGKEAETAVNDKDREARRASSESFEWDDIGEEDESSRRRQ